METLIIPVGGEKRQIYEAIVPQIEAVISGETDEIANMANVAAILKEALDMLWVGFYIVKSDNSILGSSLVLGPFQGPLACSRIAYGKGVCGTSWRDKATLIVPDVEKFPGHIACSSLSRSEIVVPLIKNGEVVAVLDIDSKLLDSFDDIDATYLESIVGML
jgi:GAF domain-containing protein